MKDVAPLTLSCDLGFLCQQTKIKLSTEHPHLQHSICVKHLQLQRIPQDAPLNASMSFNSGCDKPLSLCSASFLLLGRYSTEEAKYSCAISGTQGFKTRS